jgi:hypothetical protein
MINTLAIPPDLAGESDSRQDELAPKLIAELVAYRRAGNRPLEQATLRRLGCECAIELAFADDLVKGGRK